MENTNYIDLSQLAALADVYFAELDAAEEADRLATNHGWTE